MDYIYHIIIRSCSLVFISSAILTNIPHPIIDNKMAIQSQPYLQYVFTNILIPDCPISNVVPSVMLTMPLTYVHFYQCNKFLSEITSYALIYS